MNLYRVTIDLTSDEMQEIEWFVNYEEWEQETVEAAENIFHKIYKKVNKKHESISSNSS